MALRGGFRIPNADTFAPDFQTSQPDQGDFLILGNSQYGVITGCEISLSAGLDGGGSVAVGPGPNLLVVAGSVYELASGSSGSVTGSGSLARFDLVVYDTNLSAPFSVVQGTSAANPVFPDVTSTMTVLAAVFIPAAGGSGSPHLIDKRNFLQTEVVAVNSPTILKNYDSSGSNVKVSIDGDGKISWGSGSSIVDTTLERLGSAKLGTAGEFKAGILTADSSATVAGKDVITTETIDWGNSRPAVETADIGDVYVNNTTGELSIVKLNTLGDKAWTPIEPTLPSGSVIQSLVSPDNMPGWLPLFGGTYDVGDAGNLPTLFPDWVSGDNITLPDMRGRIPVGVEINPGSTTGSAVTGNGSTSVVLDEANLPPHSHRTVNTTDSGGNHNHSGDTSSGGGHSHTLGSAGSHTHTASDSGHWHYWEGGLPIVAVIPGDESADSCMDNIFVDASHTYVTKPSAHSMFGTANITVQATGEHSHSVGSVAGHTHPISSMSMHDGHTHTLPEHQTVGSGAAFTVQPPTLNLYFYIKI